MSIIIIIIIIIIIVIIIIKWDQISAIKFEAERLHFFSDVAVAVVVVWASYY